MLQLVGVFEITDFAEEGSCTDDNFAGLEGYCDRVNNLSI